jgi:tRNA A-37 threonylcarbamoyl transferase component Bud32
MTETAYSHSGFPGVAYGISMPFRFTLGDVPEDEQVVSCEHAERILPDRRLVCSGHWKGQRIVAKIFVDHLQAEGDWQRECDGAQLLARSGLKAPRILHAGRVGKEPLYTVIYENLDGAILFREAWLAAGTVQRNQMLADIVRVVASMHAAGLVQKDLHLNNFMLRDGDIYILDAGDIETISDMQDGLENLALLYAQFPPDQDSELSGLLSVYKSICEITLSGEMSRSFMQTVAEKRQYRKRKYLEKIYRECTAIISSSTFSHFLVLSREYDSDAIRQLSTSPDRAIEDQDMTIVKDGASSTIARGHVNGRDLIIKRYNMRSLWHYLSRALRRSRASISWENAHRLMFLGIPTARPIAMREERFGLIRLRSYIIMEALDGPNIYKYLVPRPVSDSDQRHHAMKVACLFSKLQASRICHGDMKASNIVLHNGEYAFIDLDSMREYKSESGFARAFRKDIERFFQNWEKLPEIHRLFVDAFHDAGIPLPASITGRHSA